MSVARGEPRVAAGIAAAKAARRRVEGHNAGASYNRLNELSLAGISADHEAITAAEALDRLAPGDVDDAAPVLAAAGPPGRCWTGCTTVIGSARRLMFTTDGATPSFYAERGVIGGALRIASDRGVEPMRALQMATIDPATFLGLDEHLGGIAPGRAATFNVLPEVGEWRPETVYVRGEVVARDGRLVAELPAVPWPAGPGLVAPDAALFAPLTGTVPVARYESAVINRRVDREVAPGDVHAVLVGRDGSWAAKGVVERFLDVDGFATTATTSLELLVVGRDPAAMARAAARVAEMGGGFAFDGGWSAPLEIDGLISSGTFDTTVAIDSRLSDEMSERWVSVPRSPLQLAVRVGRLPAGVARHAERPAGGEVAHHPRCCGAAVNNSGTLVDRRLEAGHGDKVAIRCSGETVTYAQLHDRICRAGNVLEGLGVGREDRVLMILDDSPTFAALFLGAMRAGAVPAPVSFLDTTDNFAHYARDSYAKVIVAEDALLERLPEGAMARSQFESLDGRFTR